MKLLARSMFRHMREHLLQTFFTMLVSVLVTGMLSVLFIFAASFRESLRSYALERNGTYHYKYYTNAGTGVARMFAETERRFKEDGWFSGVELVEDSDQVSLILTVAHPNLFTSKIMKRKFDAVKKACYEETNEIFYMGQDHNYELLAATWDMSRENGIYSFLLVFLVLLAAVSVAACLTLSAVFRVSAMQREREIALLAGIGAGRGQIIRMILMESLMYCLASLPAGFLLGILIYRGVQGHFDNIIYSLLRFPPLGLVISWPYIIVLAGCSACVILLSGLQSAIRVVRISPVEGWKRIREIKVRRKRTAGVREEVAFGREDREGKAKAGKNITHDWKRAAGENVFDGRMMLKPESWLAKKSWQRFRRRNRPILVMLVVTLALCFVLNGFKSFATEVIKMNFDMQSCNYTVDLFSDDKEELDRAAALLAEDSGKRLVRVREAVFSLREPYPFSEFGAAFWRTNSGMLPDVSLICLEEGSFEKICAELGVIGDTGESFGILLDTERSWRYEGVKVKGRPFQMGEGEKLRFFASPEPVEGEEEFFLTVAGIYRDPVPYMENVAGVRMQVLVPETVFSAFEEKRRYRELEPGNYHISLRGDIEDGKDLTKTIEERIGKNKNITYVVYDLAEQIRREKASVDSFEFLCRAMIAVFIVISICGNFTISWAMNIAREREYAILLSVGMESGSLQRMRLLELLRSAVCAFLPGVSAGLCVYQLIYLIYTTEYQIDWCFPINGILSGMAVLVVSFGASELALQIGNRAPLGAYGGKSLAERLKLEE